MLILLLVARAGWGKDEHEASLRLAQFPLYAGRDHYSADSAKFRGSGPGADIVDSFFTLIWASGAGRRKALWRSSRRYLRSVLVYKSARSAHGSLLCEPIFSQAQWPLLSSYLEDTEHAWLAKQPPQSGILFLLYRPLLTVILAGRTASSSSISRSALASEAVANTMAVSSEEPRPNGAINNSTMEMTTVNGSSSVHATSDQHVYSTTDRLTVVSKAIPIIRQRIIELEICDQSYINSTTLEGFLEFITKERLTRVPHRGSRWDRVLKCAEYFALQISVYGDSIEGFAPRSKSGCQMALSQCRVLLEVR